MLQFLKLPINNDFILLQAVLDDNLVMVRLLIQHGAKINKKDEDGWTPLHAAAANSLHHIAR